jgi:hypothetical protein
MGMEVAMIDKKILGFILILFIIILIGGVIFIFQIVDERAAEIIQPFKVSQDQLATQVSQVLNPTPTIVPDPITIIHDIRSLARLETIQYSVEKVITAEIGQDNFSFLFGDKLLFIAHGTVIAGMDLSLVKTDDLILEDQALYVRLPQPEVFIASLDNDLSYVYDRETGLFTKGDINLETTARIAAEQAIEVAALEDGVLETARINAEAYLSRLFNALGYKEVIFSYQE